MQLNLCSEKLEDRGAAFRQSAVVNHEPSREGASQHFLTAECCPSQPRRDVRATVATKQHRTATTRSRKRKLDRVVT